jgi:rfaE bifunctional protein nucleotidyltransferase chain/domain
LSTEHKIVNDPAELERRLATLARPVVFTNGCFDILHRGHVAYLEEAADLGASLVVGVNTDDSVRSLNKGTDRPLNTLEDRMAVLAALQCVTLVVPFAEDTPLALIRRVHPDLLVKGGDWAIGAIVGADEVRAWGGSVHTIPIRHRRSTTELVERIRRG